jgi:aminoglycoside phosphotransferase (APT) family kinase protein
VRSPDAETVRARCHDALPALLRAHDLGPAADVVADTEGWVNPCFFVVARDAGLPVPGVVVHDATLAAAPYEVLVTERLPGNSVELAWPDLDDEARARIAEATGAVMAGLHGIDPGGFGELSDPADGRAASWPECCRRLLEDRLDAALRDGVFDASDAQSARDVLSARERELLTVERAGLVHGDLHFANLLQHDGRLTGVIDFEWSLAGDPDMELVSTGFIEDICPGSLASVVAAYRARRPEPPELERRLDVYRVLHNVMMCVTAARHFSADEASEFVAATRRHLNHLARSTG